MVYLDLVGSVGNNWWAIDSDDYAAFETPGGPCDPLPHGSTSLEGILPESAAHRPIDAPHRGYLSLWPSSAHALVRTAVDLCCKMSCLHSLLVGQLWILVQSLACHIPGMPLRFCKVRKRMPTEYAILLEARMFSHAGWEASPHARGVHALNEAIYQESRAQAEAARELLPDAVLNGTATDMGSNVRLWVSHCSLLKCLPHRRSDILSGLVEYRWLLRAVNLAGPLLSYIQLSASKGATGPNWYDTLHCCQYNSHHPYMH